MSYLVYRLGDLPEGWDTEDGLKPMDFLVSLEGFIADNYTHAWSVRDNDDPVVIIFGIDVAGFIVVGDVIWNPKATARQKIEVVAKFLDKRKNILIMAVFETKKFYERLMDYGYLRRVGTNYRNGERLAQFETRAD